MQTRGRLLFSAAPPVLAALIGGLAARDAPEVYERLDKPDWAPPPWAFGPVWSVLYALNGVAGWRAAEWSDRRGRRLHLAQLALNAAWTPVFFGAGRRREALAVSVLLDLTIAAEIRAALREGDRTSAAALTPYLAWSGFATVLTANVGEPPR